MAVPKTTRYDNGPWDVVYIWGDKSLGFLTVDPAQEQLITQFAPNVRFANNAGYEYSEAVYQKNIISHFAQGGDLSIWEQDSRRYNWSDGNVALYKEDRITLASQWSESDTSVAATAPRIVDFEGVVSWVVVGVGTKLRAYNTTSGLWTDQAPTAFGANVVDIFSTQQYLFCALGSGVDAERWDGTAGGGWTTLTGMKADHFFWFNDTLYRALGNEISSDNSSNAGTAFNAGIKIGFDDTDIIAVAEGAGFIIIAKPEGIYACDGTDVYRIHNTQHIQSTLIGRGFMEYNGALMLPFNNEVIQLNLNGVQPLSVSITDITPDMTGDDNKELYGHGAPLVMFQGARKMYMALDDGEGVYPELLAYNGIGWHQVYRGTSGDTMRAAGFSRLMNWVLVNDGSTRRKRVINLSDSEYPDYATSGVFTTPDFDAGLPDIQKSWPYISLVLEDVDADNAVKIEYSTDKGDTWTTVETATAASDLPQVFQLDTTELMVASYRIRFRFTLTRDAADSSKTPKIRFPMVLAVSPLPPPYLSVSDVLEIDPMKDLWNGFGRVGDAYTVEQAMNYLDDLRRTKDVVVRIDESGRRSWYKLSDYVVLATGRTQHKEAGKRYDWRQVQLNFAEVFSGISKFPKINIVSTVAASADVGALTTRRYGLGVYGMTEFV